MKKKSKYTSFLKEYRKSPLVYIALSVMILSAFFVRIYRINELLGFYYDQGRDALVIWDLWHKGKFFLIGPTTGIEGIFRGPWYYWLIAPFYLLGQGNPVWPSVFLSITTVLAIYFLFLLAKEIAGYKAGVLAAVIAGFSYQLVYASRWLSNPTPMLLISMIFVWSLFQITQKKSWAWVLASFMMGMAIQFGSAAEIFYIPAFLIFAFWQRKSLPERAILFVSFFAFLLAFLPQIFFDIRHHGILSSVIIRFLVEEGSFKLSFWEVIKIRVPFYYQLFTSLLWQGGKVPILPFVGAALLFLVIKWKDLWKNGIFKLVLLFFLSPLVGMLFFQGNQGNVYGYYFTGYYLVFVLLFSVLLSSFSKNILGKLVIFVFLVFFVTNNFPLVKGYITSGVDGPSAIALGNQKQALDWVFKDASGKEFNLDAYVPPVIPHAYDYLSVWQGDIRCGEDLCGLKTDKQVPLLYTLYEVDPPHPERLEAWLARQEGLGVVGETVVFGGITVERRKRI